MTTNPYFNFTPTNVTSEQLLVEDLCIEAMQIHGMDVYYLPRTSGGSEDLLYGEDTNKQYVSARQMEMYLENTQAMEGEGDFISKFGLDIRDESTFLVSRQRFKMTFPTMTRPREGDLLYVPLVENFFEITHVEHENNQAMFYTLGRGRGGNVYVYSLHVRQFAFSDEYIFTGRPEVDNQIIDAYRGTNLILTVGGTGTYDAANNEIVYQGANVSTATAKALVRGWDSTTRILDVIRSVGTWSTANVIGSLSGAQWALTTTDVDTNIDTAVEDLFDTKTVQTEADSIIDFSESNPFSEGGL